MKRISIEASRQYDVIIGSNLLKDTGAAVTALTDAKIALLVSDDHVWALYGYIVRQSLEKAGLRVVPYVFPAGEQSKNISVYEDCLETMCQARLTRRDIAIALGGGVVGDLTGFAAATYQRGIGFIQLPTTLLAAVDSSVGGKTAINLKSGKNQVGCFHQPLLVLCDTDTLQTLPPEEQQSDYAEIIKYAMLGSESFFEQLYAMPTSLSTEEIIAHCVEQKKAFVHADEFDRGSRMLLNFGHTFGHAAEVCSGYQLRHGQGVAMGMAAITKSAVHAGICTEETCSRLRQLLQKLNLPTKIPYALEDMVRAALSDKKADGEKLHLIVPERIGKCRIETIRTEELAQWMKNGGIL